MRLKGKNKIIKFITTFICFVFIVSTVPVFAVTEYVNTVKQNVDSRVGETYSGFKLIEEKPLKDQNTIVKVFQHEKSGAKVVHFENDDDNKMFAITFKTLTSDDTGVNHILEHSVLCGSERFPLKDPFAKLLNSSLNSFLNALTFEDKTSYPIVSRYEKDFRNLMTVYLDAVFFPNLTKNENIFKQEGWRYELKSKEDELKINGVVYNEMKGDYSNPETILLNSIYKSLFPDTIYKNVAGGDPEKIPTLTYEKFKETYKKYYKPSNANIFLYGNLDILETLKFMDKDYLSKFDKEEVDTNIDLQKPFNERVQLTSEYNVIKGTSVDKKDMLSLNFVVDTIKDRNSYFTLKILPYLLSDAPNAPLKEALKKNGFKGDMKVGVIDGLQPVLSISLKDVNCKDKELFEKITLDTMKDIVKDGFDKKNIDLVLKDNELYKKTMKNSSFKGMLYLFTVINVLNYDLDPILYLEDSDFKEDIRNKINNGEKYFEKYLEEKILNNKHSSLVILKAKSGLEEEKTASMKKKLAEYKATLSEEEINSLIKETEDFKKWQETPDSPEALKTLPTLSLSDLDKKPQAYPTDEKIVDGVKVLYHPYETDGVAYFNAYFNTKNIPQDKLNYLKLYTILMDNIDRKDYSKEEFERRSIGQEILLLSIPQVVQKYGSTSEYTPIINLTGIFDLNKMDKAIPLINDIIMNPNFNDKKNSRENILNMINSLEQVNANSGAELPMKSIVSTFSKASMYDSMEVNNEFIKFLKNLEANFDKEWDNVVKNMEEIKETIYNKDNTIISITCNEKYIDKFTENIKNFTKNLGNRPFIEQDYDFKLLDKNIAYINNEELVYVAKGDNFKNIGYSYNGTMMVANLILNDYLFSTVRMRGGAYGVESVVSENGTLLMTSYRDPNVKETLQYFNYAPEFLKNLKLSDEDLKKYIITAIGKLDIQADPSMVGSIANSFYLSKFDINELKNIRSEILNTKIEDINKFGKILEEVLKKNNYSVSGNKQKIEDNKELFNKVIDLTNQFDDNQNEKPKNQKIRLQGKNRYETAASVAKEGWTEAENAIICYGKDFPDALVSVPLSKKYDAPILLTEKEKLNDITKNTLKELKVKKVFIIGLKGVVSSEVEKEINSMGIKIERLGGNDRYETSIKVAEKLGEVDKLVLTTGKEFGSALSIGSYAANNNTPIILVDDDKVEESLKSYLKSKKIHQVYYVGNENIIGKNIIKILPNGKRIYSDDMYLNNINILKTFGKDLDIKNIFIATGKDFADALCGAALAAKMNSPLLLMNKKIEVSTKNYLKTIVSNLENIYVLGSEGAIESQTLEEYMK